MLTNIRFVKLAQPYNINLSDHLPTLLVYKIERERKKIVQLTCRSYSDETIEKLRKLVSFPLLKLQIII